MTYPKRTVYRLIPLLSCALPYVIIAAVEYDFFFRFNVYRISGSETMHFLEKNCESHTSTLQQQQQQISSVVVEVPDTHHMRRHV